MTATLPTVAPTRAPASRRPNGPNRTDVGACANDPNPDRWVDLPPIRIRGRANPDYHERVEDLSRTCATCPIQSTCLYDALRVDVAGVWGGTDEFDRADMRETIGLPAPKRLTFGALTVDVDPTDQDVLRFQARRLAAKTDLTLAKIAEEMGVSPMTVTRLLDEREPDEIPRRVKRSA